MSRARHPVTLKQAMLRTIACLFASICLLTAAVRFGVYDIELTEQLLRIAMGALR